MTKKLYEIGEQPPLGEVPETMHAWVIRPERFGEPKDSFQLEVIDTPEIADNEVLVYVMAAGVNYNNVWAGLGLPVNVIAARQKAGEKEAFHIGGSDASGIVYKVGKNVSHVKVGDEVVAHCGTWDEHCPVVQRGEDPMFSPSFRIWGYETNYGSFAQFTRVQAQQVLPKPRHLSWEEAASYMLVGATAYRQLTGWEPHAVKHDDVVLIWGGAGGLGSMAIQIVKALGGIPIAVVSSPDKVDYCMNLGAKGVINRKEFDHWGMLPHWKDAVGYGKWLSGVRKFGKALWDAIGEKRSPRIVFEHPGESTMPTSLFVTDTGGMVVICAGTTGYNATVDLRYLWMRQKRVQGSHFANRDQADQFNRLVLENKIDPCLSRTFTWNHLWEPHQLMHDNQHPHGNMAVLVGANEAGQGISIQAQRPDLGTGVLDQGEPEETYTTVKRPALSLKPVDDGTTVGVLMHEGVLTCPTSTGLDEVAGLMVKHSIHALVVTDAEDAAVGVISQTDLVLARQGRSNKERCLMNAEDIMTPGLVTCRRTTPVSEAITTMTRQGIHRLVVVEQRGKRSVPVGVVSMTDIIRRMLDEEDKPNF